MGEWIGALVLVLVVAVLLWVMSKNEI